MKTITSAKRIFLLFFLTIFFVQNSISQIRLVEVDPINDTAIIQNFGSGTINIADYWFCTLFVYNRLSSFNVVSGSLNLTADATVELSGINLRDSDADLGLYDTNSLGFGSQTAMQDFMQWGDAGNGRESVANGKGIWTSGDFLAGSGPFSYNGNGNENGVSFWGMGTLSVSDEFLNANLSLYPNPVKDNLTIRSQSNLEIKNLIIFDTTGRSVLQSNFNNTLSENIVNFKSIQSGLYVIKLTDIEGRILTKKFIKE